MLKYLAAAGREQTPTHPRNTLAEQYYTENLFKSYVSLFFEKQQRNKKTLDLWIRILLQISQKTFKGKASLENKIE